MTRDQILRRRCLGTAFFLTAVLPAPAQQPSPAAMRFGADALSGRIAQPAKLTGAPSFEPNRGQWDANVLFAQRNGALTTWLTGDALTFDLHRETADAVEGAVVRLRMVGCDQEASARGEVQRRGRHNYLVGPESRWMCEVPTYDAVRRDGIYPGIALRVGTRNGYPAYDFEVAPYASLEQVVIEVEGADRLELGEDGTLQMHTPFATLVQESPVSWQQGVDGVQVMLASSFRLLGGNRFGFAVPDREVGSALVIDPTVRWGTFLGGTGDDNAVVVLRTRGDTVTIMGRSRSLDFPTSAGAYRTAFGGGTWDGFVAKFDPSESGDDQLVFSTWIGGNGDDTVLDGVEDPANGDLYLVGASFSTDLAMSGGPAMTNLGQEDATLMVLGADGASVSYGTYLGGNDLDWANQIHVDWAGHVVTIAGYTASTDLAAIGAYQSVMAGERDAFVQRLDLGRPPAQQLTWSTYVGGSTFEGSNSTLPWNRQDMALQVHGSGEVTLAAQTSSADFPTTPGTLKPTFVGTAGAQTDIGIVRLDPAQAGAAQLRWGTYVGGGTDGAYDICYGAQTMPDGSMWFGGISYDPTFPTTAGAFRTAMDPANGITNHDGILFRLSGDGRTLIYSTLFGATSSASTGDFVVEPSGTIVTTGFTFGVVPTTNGARWPTRISVPAPDAFIARLDPRGHGDADLLYSSYFGGSGGESSFGIVSDGRGGAFATGVAVSADFPVTPGGWQTTNQGGPRDAWVLHVDLLPVGVDRVGEASPACARPMFLVPGGSPSVATWDLEIASNGAHADDLGLVMLGQLRANPLYIPGLMLTMFVNPMGTIVVRADSSGFARVPIALPRRVAPGTSIAVQAMWLAGGQSCSPLQVTDALAVTVQQ